MATETEIIDHVRGNLARFKAPKSVEFKNEFPKGGTGKILKQELKKAYWAGLNKKVH